MNKHIDNKDTNADCGHSEVPPHTQATTKETDDTSPVSFQRSPDSEMQEGMQTGAATLDIKSGILKKLDLGLARRFSKQREHLLSKLGKPSGIPDPTVQGENRLPTAVL